jgi:protein phosphatase
VKLKIPEMALVVLIGPSGAGKSTFVRKHFGPYEAISSDFCRGLVCNDENSLEVHAETFDLVATIAGVRLKRGLLTVIDATNVSPRSRERFVALAREYHVLPVAIVFDLPKSVCIESNATRDRPGLGPHVVIAQKRELDRSIRRLGKEGFRHVHILKSRAEIDAAEIAREPLWNNLKNETGPFDIIGDIHGCYDELVALIEQLGYRVGENFEITPPEGRRLILLGDLVDRGPRVCDVLRLAMRADAEGKALCVPGNHDIKLMRALRGTKVTIAHGLEQSLEQFEPESAEFKAQVVAFIDDLVSHYILDHGKLVVAHAGMKEELQGRGSARVREFALYGETTGETDEFGFPTRFNWAEAYRGKALVVYGHTAVSEPVFLNRTINIDTGCVYGGRLTAYRYPEGEIVSVPAAREYSAPVRPLVSQESELTAQQVDDGLLYIDDIFGKRAITTSLRQRVVVREENAAPALEIISRFGVDPRWLIYLPPTMSPPETTSLPGLIEHPAQAFDYFAKAGVSTVVCEEKHMGSRAVVVLCRNEDVARRRFGALNQGIGTVYTRTGRAFFRSDEETQEFLRRIRDAFNAAGAWELLASDWACLDCELMPWSAKARELLVQQYAPVGCAGTAMLERSVASLEAAIALGSAELEADLAKARERLAAVTDYRAAYRRYCWDTPSLDDLRLAPFHILATEGACHTDKPHTWHMDTISTIAEFAATPILIATRHCIVKLDDDGDVAGATEWWTKLTGNGGEGMVVKPLDFIAHGKKGLIQPAIKVRGREYLRIIYGPEYTRPANIERLRSRSVSSKRSLALREFALGVESLERFTRNEPLRRVHECVLAVLAFETEAIDPRL